MPGTGPRRVADGILRSSPGCRIAVEIEHREAELPLVSRAGGGGGAERVVAGAGAVVRDLATDEVRKVCLVHRDGRLSPAAVVFCRAGAVPPR